MTITVILGALLGIAEYRVGFGSLLELLFGFVVSGVAIGVVLHRQFAVSAFDLLIGGAFGNVQDFIVVTPGAQSTAPYLPAETLTIAARSNFPFNV